MDNLEEILIKIIKSQEPIIGPVAWQEASKVDAIQSVDFETNSVVVKEKSDRGVIEKLINQYELNFGAAARQICREAISTYTQISTSSSQYHLSNITENLYKHSLDLVTANRKLKEFDRLKAEIASLATHHIGTPLTAIRGYVSLLQEGNYGEISKDMQKALDVVQKSTNNLMTIIRDFLEVTKIDQGEIKYTKTYFDIKELLENIFAKYEKVIDKERLDLSITISHSQNYNIYADKQKVEHSIVNILENSLKFTETGSIKITLKNDASKCVIKIIDTGMRNIPKNSSKSLNMSTGNQFEADVIGNDLGLYITKQHIEAQGGRFSIIYNKENVEAEFTVEYCFDTIFEHGII